jgi:hypothetical protein
MANYLNLAEIDNAVNSNKMAELQRSGLMQNLLRQKKLQEQEDAMQEAFKGSVGPDGTMDETSLYKRLAQVDPMKAYEMQSGMAARKLQQQTSDMEMKIKKAKYGRDVMASVTPETWAGTRQQLIEQGFEFAKNLPETYDETAHKASVMDADSFLQKQSGGSNQEYVYQNTPDGIVQLGKRDGFEPKLVINPATGKPFVASSASPELQGMIASSKANANNMSDLGYKPQIRRAEAQVDLETKPAIALQESQAKEMGKTNAENLAAIPNAEDALTSVQDAKAMLQAGIYSGGYSDMKQKIAKYTPLGNDTKLANTEQFISHIGNTVVPRLKEFGGNDSNEEMRYLKSIMGGDVSMQPESLAKILDRVEAKIQRGIEYKKRGLDANGKMLKPSDTKSNQSKLKNIITLPDGRKLGINAQGKAELVK